MVCFILSIWVLDEPRRVVEGWKRSVLGDEGLE